MAVILGRGIAEESVMVTAQRLLSQFGGLKGIALASLEELVQVRYIGLSKAAQIRACVEIPRRISDLETADRIAINTSEGVFNLAYGRLQGEKKEYFLAALFNTSNHLIKLAEVSVGSLGESIVYPQGVFREVISATTASVIFIHKHLSGEVEASDDDMRLTKRLAEEGEIVGINVLNHAIISDKNYKNQKWEGLF